MAAPDLETNASVDRRHVEEDEGGDLTAGQRPVDVDERLHPGFRIDVAVARYGDARQTNLTRGAGTAGTVWNNKPLLHYLKIFCRQN